MIMNLELLKDASNVLGIDIETLTANISDAEGKVKSINELNPKRKNIFSDAEFEEKIKAAKEENKNQGKEVTLKSILRGLGIEKPTKDEKEAVEIIRQTLTSGSENQVKELLAQLESEKSGKETAIKETSTKYEKTIEKLLRESILSAIPLEIADENLLKIEREKNNILFSNFAKIQINENGNPLFYDSENKPFKDEFGNPMTKEMVLQKFVEKMNIQTKKQNTPVPDSVENPINKGGKVPNLKGKTLDECIELAEKQGIKSNTNAFTKFLREGNYEFS